MTSDTQKGTSQTVWGCLLSFVLLLVPLILRGLQPQKEQLDVLSGRSTEPFLHTLTVWSILSGLVLTGFVLFPFCKVRKLGKAIVFAIIWVLCFLANALLVSILGELAYFR